LKEDTARDSEKHSRHACDVYGSSNGVIDGSFDPLPPPTALPSTIGVWRSSLKCVWVDAKGASATGRIYEMKGSIEGCSAHVSIRRKK